MFHAKQDKKKRHNSASKRATIITKTVSESSVIAIFVCSVSGIYDWGIWILQTPESTSKIGKNQWIVNKFQDPLICFLCHFQTSWARELRLQHTEHNKSAKRHDNSLWVERLDWPVERIAENQCSLFSSRDQRIEDELLLWFSSADGHWIVGKCTSQYEMKTRRQSAHEFSERPKKGACMCSALFALPGNYIFLCALKLNV